MIFIKYFHEISSLIKRNMYKSMTRLCHIYNTLMILFLLKSIIQHIKHIQRINPNPENRFPQPILKDGLVLEDIMVENETKRKNKSKINEFKNLCKTQNIREIRKYIKRNDIINSLNT